MEWISVYDQDNLPPDEMVRVKDELNNEAYASPTYYPFTVEKLAGDEKKQWGWRGTPVFHEDGEMRWDGGWMIQCEGLDSPIAGKITHWALAELMKDENSDRNFGIGLWD